jgi:hypothetical protein
MVRCAVMTQCGYDTVRPVNCAACARPSGSSARRFGSPETLAGQHLCSPVVEYCGGPSTPRPRASPTTASPTPTDSLRVDASYPFPLRCLLPQHHSLAEGGYRAPSPLALQHGSHYRRQQMGNAPACAAPSSPPPHRNGDTSLLIRYRYSLKQPCPVSTCVTLYVRGGPPPSSQSPQCGRTASTTLSPGAPVLVSSRERHTPSRACLAPVLTSAPARPLPPSGRPRVWR